MASAAARVIKAYWGSGSAPARRMQLALEEKGLAYESHLLSFSKKEHKGPDVLAIYPRGKVPALLDGDVPVYESLAIIEYLERAYPDKHPLLPTDNKGLAEALSKMHETIYLVDAHNAVARHFGAADKNEAWKTKLEELKPIVYAEVKHWDAVVTGKPFLAGEKVSVADVAFFPYLDVLVRNGLSFEKYPNLKAYHESYSCRPAAIATSPPHWKDGPGPKLYD